MQTNRNQPTSTIDWDAFQAQLTDYVHLELAGQAADEVYPEIAYYIETSEQCEGAYYLEFRKQGLRKPVSELRHVGYNDQVDSVMQRIRAWSEIEQVPDPNWYEVALERGRGWLEQETNRWRQLWLNLPTWSAGQEPALVTGLLSADAPASPVTSDVLRVAPENADFEVTLIVLPDTTADDDELCRLDVVVTLTDRFGDFSGVRVTLLGGDTTRQKTTDALGKVSFAGLPIDQLTLMSVLLALPT